MPLSWKKLRVSELVADLRSPSKRRGSLIVETGFPTSLIDLFVKNRDRLRKSSSRRKQHHRRASDSFDSRSATSAPVRTHVQAIPERSGVVEALGVAGGRCCDGVGSEEEAVERVDGCGRSFANRVFAAVLKTFVVVAVPLSTKKLVVGITLSAFALLLLECVGKHMDPRLDASERLLDLIQTALSIFRPKKESRRLEKCESSNIDMLDQIEMLGDSNFEEEIVGREEGSGLGCVIAGKEEGYVDMRKALEENEDRGGEALLYGKNQSRSHRIKSKIIKKCVPKKLRDLRKKKKTCMGTDMEDEEESSDRSSYFSMEELGDCMEEKLECENSDNDDEKEAEIPWCCEPPLASVEGREKFGRGREGIGYQMLILIVLAGLVGGRIWAFAITLVWCLALKTLRNVPMLRSLVSIRR